MRCRTPAIALAALVLPAGPAPVAHVAAFRTTAAALRHDPRALQAWNAWGADCVWLGGPRAALQTMPDGCGAAALGLLLRSHGRRVPQRLLWSACRIPRGGTNLGRLLHTARSFGLDCTVGFAAAIDSLPLPAIVHLRRGHFVVLERCTAAHAVIFDPACGRVRVRAAALRQATSGAALWVRAASGPGEAEADR